MVRDRAGRAACHRLLERPQAPLCLGSQTAPSHPTSSRYRSNAESRIDLADAPLRRWNALYISTINKADDITGKACSPRMFRVNHPDSSDIAVVGPWLKQQKQQKWAIQAADMAWGHNSGESFKKAAEAAGRSIVSESYSSFGTNDYAPYIQKVTDSGAEALW